jgi:hypothetical protein
MRIAVAELVDVGLGERETVEKSAPLRVRGIGIIDRDHDAVGAERQQRG